MSYGRQHLSLKFEISSEFSMNLQIRSQWTISNHALKNKFRLTTVRVRSDQSSTRFITLYWMQRHVLSQPVYSTRLHLRGKVFQLDVHCLVESLLLFNTSLSNIPDILQATFSNTLCWDNFLISWLAFHSIMFTSAASWNNFNTCLDLGCHMGTMS